MASKRGRRHEDHYVLDHEPDLEDWEQDFVMCTPTKRLQSCPVCEAKTLAGIDRRWRVEADHWDQWCAIDSRREALGIAEDDSYGFTEQDRPRKAYRITPLWMVHAEIERMPEWEP